jgi:hypothetical protein
MKVMGILLLAAIAFILLWAVSQWRKDVALAERRIQYKRQRCADVYNSRLYVNYRKWWDEMTKEGYEPGLLSRIRALTPDEIGVGEWQTPEDYLKMDPDWRGHPDKDRMLAASYTDRQREEMKRPDFDEQRKLRQRPEVIPNSEKRQSKSGYTSKPIRRMSSRALLRATTPSRSL